MNVTPCYPDDDGRLAALVTDDGGRVIATIRAAEDTTPAEFHAAMRRLDPGYDEADHGHG